MQLNLPLLTLQIYFFKVFLLISFFNEVLDHDLVNFSVQVQGGAFSSFRFMFHLFHMFCMKISTVNKSTDYGQCNRAHGLLPSL